MGLETKYSERDLAIPKHRENLLKPIEKDLLNDANLLAVYYGGYSGLCLPEKH